MTEIWLIVTLNNHSTLPLVIVQTLFAGILMDLYENKILLNVHVQCKLSIPIFSAGLDRDPD